MISLNSILRPNFLLLFLLGAWTCLSGKAAGSNALDRIDFGNPTSEAAHNFGAGQPALPLAGVGALGQTFRAPLHEAVNYTPVPGDQELAFTLAVDPAKQNYLTIRMWGSDKSGAYTYFSGYNGGDIGLDLGSSSPVFPNRFYYSTEPIPLSMTQGKTSVPLVLFQVGFSGQPAGRPIYTAYTHTDPYFVPDSADPTGTPIAQTGQLATTSLSKAQVCAILQAQRQSVYGSGGYYNSVLSRQVTPGTAGAPPEVIGQDLYNVVANFGGTSKTYDQWRDACGSGGHGPGYSTLPDELLSVLVSTYSLPPFTDANDTVVSGLDHYHDSSIIQRIVWALDSTSYMQSSDGHFQGQPYGVWSGLTSTPRATGHAYAGSSARGPGWSISLEGVDTESLGRTICKLLDDPTAAPIFQNYLGQSFDADLTGGSMLRARAYERMLNNQIYFLYSTYWTGTESQGLFAMNGIYANRVALAKLEALFPYGSTDSSFPGSTYTSSYPYITSAQAVGFLQQITGADPAGTGVSGLYVSGYTNYGISVGGFGEAHGAISGGYDGRYGTILPWCSNMLTAAATHDSNVNATILGKVQTQARRAAEGYLHFISPNERYNGASNTFTLAQEDFITYRDPYQPNVNSGGFTVGAGYESADSALGINSPLERRGAYLEALYGVTPGVGKGGNNQLQYLAGISSYESVLRGLIGVDPATLTKLPGEPGAGNSAYVDPFTGATAIYFNGERLYINNNYRNFEYANNNYGTASNRARFHDTTATVDRNGTIMMPYDSTTVQSDGNLTGAFAQSWVTRLGNWLVAGNPTATARTISLPSGTGKALDLVSGATYAMGSSVNLPAGGTLALNMSVAPAARLLADGTYILSNAASNLLLNCPGGAATPNLQIVQAALPAGTASQWVFTYVSGFYTVKNAASGLYLTGSASSGAALVQQAASGGPSQNWQLIQSGGGYVLVNQAGGNLAINNPGASTNPGTGMILWTQDAGRNSVWTFQSTASSQILSSGVYAITSLASGLVIDNPGSSTASGQAMDQQTSNTATNQQWVFTADGNGYYTIKNASSGLCLAPADTARAFYYPNLLQKTADGSDSQLWAVFPSLQGYTFINKSTTNPINGGNGTTPGTTLTMYDVWNTGYNFNWRLDLVPSVPTGVTSTAGNATVTLGWNAVPGVTGYKIKRSTTNGGPYTAIATAGGTSFSDTGLTNGTTYYYVVAAINGNAASANSAQVTATPATSYAITASSQNPPSEGAASAFDGNTGTKWYNYSGGAYASTGWLQYQYPAGAPAVITGYVITSANDAPQRDPAAWQLLGSNDGSNWTTLDTQTAQTFAARFQPNVYAVSNATAYAYYRLNITANAGGAGYGLQLSELTLQTALTSPWQTADIGTVGALGGAANLGSQFALRGSGADIGGTADAFRYAYQTATGDCDITARVTGITNTNSWAKAGVMIRETTAANSRHAMAVVSSGSGVAFQFRSSTAGSSTNSGITGLVAPYWVRLTRAGNVFTAYCSPDGSTWTTVGTATITMATNVFIGVPACSHSAGVITTATLDNISVNP